MERTADERYGLTERGAALEPVVHALVVWGAPLLAVAPELPHVDPRAVALACRVHPEAELLELDAEHARVRVGDEVVEGAPEAVLRRLAAEAPG